jgi:hypothetical protein
MTRRLGFSAAALLALLTTGCAPIAPGQGAELRMVPDTKEVIDVLFRSEAVPMSVHPSCQAIAEVEGLETIGAFVGALLARQIEGTRTGRKCGSIQRTVPTRCSGAPR